MSEAPDPEARQHLEAERDFLLRSLDDLDAERVAGNVDDETYGRLHADYTARAAAAIRALRDGVDDTPKATPMPWSRRLLFGGAVVVFAVVAAAALAAALGARLPGQLASGNPDDESNTAAGDPRDALEAEIEADPDNIGARLALARFLEADGDFAGALAQYDAVIERQPENADALANSGRVVYLTAERVAQGSPEAVDLVNAARARLDAAVAADPDYADARFFRAVLLAEELFDQQQAITDAQRYLVLAPDGQWAEPARQLLVDLGADAPSSSPLSAPPAPGRSGPGSGGAGHP